MARERSPEDDRFLEPRDQESCPQPPCLYTLTSSTLTYMGCCIVDNRRISIHASYSLLHVLLSPPSRRVDPIIGFSRTERHPVVGDFSVPIQQNVDYAGHAASVQPENRCSSPD